MTTTVMRDSIVGDAWIQQTAAAVPIQRVIDQKTGQPTGDFLSGPVRLAFCDLFELPPATASMANPKYGAALMFSPYADFTLLYEEYYRLCAKEFPDYYDAPSQQYNGLHSPFHDQREKTKFNGFTPGCIYFSATSKFQPPVTDIRLNPIIDRSKVYAGVWAICGLNAYAYKDPRKKGIAFGLQSVMVIGDDTKLAGAGPDVKNMYAAAAGIAPPIVRPDFVQGMPMGPQGIPGAPMGPQGIPGAPPANRVPQQTYTPPVQQPPVAPGPQAYRPPVMPGVPVGPASDDDWMN